MSSRQRVGLARNILASERSLARACLAGLIVIFVGAFLSAAAEYALLPQCPFFHLTGLYCPGCGTTRMIFALAHGHLAEALHDNALSLLVLPIVLYCLLRKSFDLRLPALPQISRRWLTALTLAVVVFTIARNIPVGPFCKLAPGSVSSPLPPMKSATLTLQTLYVLNLFGQRIPAPCYRFIRVPVAAKADRANARQAIENPVGQGFSPGIRPTESMRALALGVRLLFRSLLEIEVLFVLHHPFPTSP